jgi:hypothetical protein
MKLPKIQKVRSTIRGQNRELTKKNQPNQCVTSASDSAWETFAVSGVEFAGIWWRMLAGVRAAVIIRTG